ncbi:MAG: hypothetical protein ACLFM7_11835 [Bacteroidales bacterium]
MKTLKTLLYLSLIVLITSCLEDTGSYVRTTDLVSITEVSIPDSAGVSDTIQILATAEANNGCWKDLHFRLDTFTSQNDSETDTVNTEQYTLKAIGTYESEGTCPQVIVTADTTMDVITSQKGNYVFYTSRDSYTLQMDTVFVE